LIGYLGIFNGPLILAADPGSSILELMFALLFFRLIGLPDGGKPTPEIGGLLLLA
jgi:hypothetical protein